MARKAKPKVANCQFCGKPLPSNAANGCCNKDCKINLLKSELTEAHTKLSSGKGPIKCLARINWARCAQEWYLKDSYDAKRRCCTLRHQGFTCSAQTVGAMPIVVDGETRMLNVTVLTAFFTRDEKGELLTPPDPPQIVDGLLVFEE